MFLIPHSYPNLDTKDLEKVIECFYLDYVGFDNNLNEEICNKFRSYLYFNFIETTTSGTESLNIILKFLNLNNSDEIIIQPINCWSIYNSIKQANIKPILCDTSSYDSFLPSYETIINYINKNTKVIIMTHMYGNIIDETIIKRIKENFPKIVIIEDFSTSIFSKNNYKLGKYSDFAISSFGSTKPITAGIGGLLCSKQKIFNTSYDTFIENDLTFNVKLSRLNQSLLLSQIDKFEEYQLKKKEIISFYKKFLTIYSTNNDDLFRALTFDNPKYLLKELESYNIKLDLRNNVQPNLAKSLNLDYLINSFNFKEYLSLPLNIKMYDILAEKGLI